MIYNGWGKPECGRNNVTEYLKLIRKYSIRIGLDARKFEDTDEYDVLIKPDNIKSSYVEYMVIKNKPGLTMDELALICAGGNLCFGYSNYGNLIKVYTD